MAAAAIKSDKSTEKSVDKKSKKPIVEPEKVEALFEGRKSKMSGKSKKWIIGLLILIMLLGLVGLGVMLIKDGTFASWLTSASPEQAVQKDDGLANLTSQTGDVTNDIAGISNESQGGTPNQLVNGTMSLDLSKFFSDPDNETLTFSNSPTQKFIVNYDGANAKVLAKEGQVGDEAIVFTATDPSNNTVSSNPVIFSILEEKKAETHPQASQSVLIAVAFFLVLIALVIAVLFVRKSRKEMDEEDEE